MAEDKKEEKNIKYLNVGTLLFSMTLSFNDHGQGKDNIDLPYIDPLHVFDIIYPELSEISYDSEKYG